jgi:hypothetical protein
LFFNVVELGQVGGFLRTFWGPEEIGMPRREILILNLSIIGATIALIVIAFVSRNADRSARPRETIARYLRLLCAFLVVVAGLWWLRVGIVLIKRSINYGGIQGISTLLNPRFPWIAEIVATALLLLSYWTLWRKNA